MDVNVRSNGTKVTDEMRDFIDRRMSKLDPLVNNVVDAQLELRTDRPRSGGEMTTAQITLKSGRQLLRAEVRDHEPVKAIDAAIDKLIKQVRKVSDKRAARKRRMPSVSDAMADPAIAPNGAALLGEDLANGARANERPLDLGVDELDDGDEEEFIVRTKRFSMKPMHIDEAIDQMELIGHDFFLFHNADEDGLNVLYRRRDGAYGLLAPD